MIGDPILAALVRLEAGQAKLEAGHETLLAGLAGLETRHTKLETSLAALEVGQISLRTDFLAELGSTRGAIMGRIDRWQNRFDEIRNDVNVSFNNVARVGERGVATQSEPRAMVEQYNHLYRRMQAMDARLRLLEDKRP